MPVRERFDGSRDSENVPVMKVDSEAGMTVTRSESQAMGSCIADSKQELETLISLRITGRPAGDSHNYI